MIIRKNSALTIALPAEPTKREQFAAEELKKYLQMICGVQAEISQSAGELTVAVGGPERNAVTAKYITEAEFDALVPGPEGIFIKDYGTCLVVAGSSKNENERERGTIYAAYELLERFAGCSFATYVHPEVPGGEFVPQAEELDFTGISYAKAKRDVNTRGAIVQNSVHGIRENFTLARTFWDWLGKNRFNHIYTWNKVYEHFKENGLLEETEKRGFILEVGHHDSIDTMLPPHGNKYFPEHYYETHPEYYRLNEDGTRFEIINHWGQMALCSRNEEMIEQLAQNMISWLDQNPLVKVYNWCDKDGMAPQCCCEKCKPYTKSQNSQYMLNRLAERIKEKHPDVKLSSLAYVDSWEPPEGVDTMNPNRMVCEAVWHSTGLRKTGKPDGSCLANTLYEDNLLAWKNKYNIPVFYYDYFMGVYPGRQRIVPMADEIQAMYRRFMEKGIEGSETQIEVFNLWNNLLNFYCFGRTGYDTELSLEDNIQKLCRVFGKGAPYVAENLRYFEEVLDGQCEIMTAGVYFMRHVDKERVYANYDKALAAAEGDSAARNNIRMIRMAFRYSDLETREEYAMDEKGFKALKHYDIPERGELLYMQEHFDSFVSHAGYGIAVPVEGEPAPFTPTDSWYEMDK